MFESYLFEANSIQDFVFATGKLRDAAGASDLLVDLAFEGESGEPDGKVVPVLAAARLTLDTAPDIGLHRCAGGVISLVAPKADADKLRRFRAAWRLTVETLAPGLGYTDAIGVGDSVADALASARAALQAAAPCAHPDAPPGGPLLRMATRTDRPPAFVPKRVDKTGRCAITGEYADRATLAKRARLADKLHLPGLFAGDLAASYDWPLSFDNDETAHERHEALFPFTGNLDRVAMVHVDGNGVGQKFLTLAEKKAAALRTISRGLASQTEAAVNAAMRDVVLTTGATPGHESVAPARPILLGGDDLTIILRADLAFDFVRSFVGHFETNTASLFKNEGVAEIMGDGGLTAKAGIVFMAPKQPFWQAYELCESLAEGAKDLASSKIAFWRLVRGIIPQDRDELAEMTTRKDGLTLWREAWSREELEKLETLARLLESEEVARGSMRRIPEMLLAAPGDTDELQAAHDIYLRALEVLGKRAPAKRKDFEAAMAAFGVSEPAKDFVTKDNYTPLLDAHALAHIRHGGEA